MANDKSFKIKNGLLAGRYYGNNGTETAGANGPYGTFDTTTYSGTGATQTITNNVDLSTDGGLVWIKDRNLAKWHKLYDTERGATKALFSNEQDAENTNSTTLTSFNSNGFTLGAGGTGNNNSVNESSGTYVAWTFKQASNFFDVVTYTGDGDFTGRAIPHNLGTTVGSIFIKKTSGSANWIVYHRSEGATKYLELDNTSVSNTYNMFNDTDPTSTEFYVSSYSKVNESGSTYVAYLFAHDTSDDGYIQCGSYTGNGSTDGPEINLGWEPSWCIIKRTDDVSDWRIFDSMRGWVVGGDDAILKANTSGDEAGSTFNASHPTPTGFKIESSSGSVNGSGGTYIYIAIRAVVQTQTLDLSTGHTFSFTPTEALDILFSNPPASGTATGFSVEVNNTGGYALTWPSSVKWDSGTAPTATASKEVYTFITTDGGTTYYGKKAAGDIA